MRGDAALSYACRADFIHGLCPCNFIACHGEACMRRRIPADYVQILSKVPADYVQFLLEVPADYVQKTC